MRTPFVPTDPVTAKEIAIHTEATLQQIRSCDSIGSLKKIYDGYDTYSNTMKVVKPIRDHVQEAFNETATLIAARERNAKKTAAKETTDRIIGENGA
jgi:predicted transcriptional regulator